MYDKINLKINITSISKQYKTASQLLSIIDELTKLSSKKVILDMGIYCIINNIQVEQCHTYNVFEGYKYIQYLISEIKVECEKLPRLKQKVYHDFLDRLLFNFYRNQHKPLAIFKAKGYSIETLYMLQLINFDLETLAKFNI